MTFEQFLENLGCDDLSYDEWAIGLDVEQGKWRYKLSENDPEGLFESAFYHDYNEEQTKFLKILYKRFLIALERPVLEDVP